MIGHVHSHGPPGYTKSRDLKMAMWLTGVYFLLEFFVGRFSGSIPMIGDSFHMFVDLTALLLAYWVNSRKPSDGDSDRVEKRVTAVNLVILSAVIFWMVYEIICRGSAQVTGLPIFLVACFGFIINIKIYRILNKHSEATIKSANICSLPDAISSFAIMLNGALLMIFGRTFFWANSVAALVIIAVLLYTIYEIVLTFLSEKIKTSL